MICPNCGKDKARNEGEYTFKWKRCQSCQYEYDRYKKEGNKWVEVVMEEKENI